MQPIYKPEIAEQKSCPACMTAERSEFERFADLAMYKCANCDLVYSSPMKAMDPDEYSKMYGDSGLHNDFATALENGHLEFLKRNKPTLDKNRLLDIGTSTGLFIHAADRAGFAALGIETDAKAVAEGRKMFPEIILENRSLEDLFMENKKYEYITLFEVLEHVSNPKQILEAAKKLLAPKGKLVIFVPNRKRTPGLYSEMVERGIDVPPHHLSKWSKKSLAMILNSVGLNGVTVKDIGKYRLPMLPALGVASMIKNKIIKNSYKVSGDISMIKENLDVLRSAYGRLARARLVIDKILFFWIDLIYYLRGYEKDGLYGEGINQ